MTEFSDPAHIFGLLSQNPAGLQVWDAYDSVYNHAILAGRGSTPPNDSGPTPALFSLRWIIYCERSAPNAEEIRTNGLH